MMKQSKSIVSVLYLNTLSTLLVFIFIVAIINNVISAQLNSSAIQNGRIMVQGITNNLQQRMFDQEHQAREIQSILISEIVLEKDIEQFLSYSVNSSEFIMAIEITDQSGTVTHSVPNKFDSEGMDRSGETFYKNVKPNGEIYWSKIFTFFFTGEPVITLSQKMGDQILVIYMDANKISEIFTNFAEYMGDSTKLTVMDERGTYLTYYNQSVISRRDVNDEFPLIQKSIEDKTGSYRSVKENALVNIVYLDTFKWYVAIYTSMDYISKPITSINNLLYVFAFLILGLSVFFFVKSKSISTSILEFSKQSNKIAAGNYDLSLSPQKFRELQILGGDFEKMNSEIVNRDQQLRKMNQSLVLRLSQTIGAISKISELKDVYTAGHQRKVAELACAIAQELGLSDEKISNISSGALIHDIGKISVASDILNKPGKISTLEYQVLQTHAESGYEIVKEIDFPPQVLEMIHQHHERLDGSGYPQKLVGEQIILESRILAVADVVDAMTSHRPYRPALGIDAALEEISLYRGKKYDCAVVDACVTLFREKGFQFMIIN